MCLTLFSFRFKSVVRACPKPRCSPHGNVQCLLPKLQARREQQSQANSSNSSACLSHHTTRIWKSEICIQADFSFSWEPALWLLGQSNYGIWRCALPHRSKEPDVNDTSQEVLLLNCMTLIKKTRSCSLEFEVRSGRNKTFGTNLDVSNQCILALNQTAVHAGNCLRLTQSKSSFEVAFILPDSLRRMERSWIHILQLQILDLTDCCRYAGLLGFLRSAMKESLQQNLQLFVWHTTGRSKEHPELRLRLLCREAEAPVLQLGNNKVIQSPM